MEGKDIFDVKKIITQDLYVYINKRLDIMKLSTNKLNETDYLLLSANKQLWSKNELGEVIKSFNIRRIEYADTGEQILIKYLYNKRSESYEHAIKSCHRMYIKKTIFLLKNTLNVSYAKILKEQKFIVLAKPNKEKGTTIDFYCMKKTKKIPVFSDSSEVESFFVALDNKAAEIQKEYSMLNIKFKDLYDFVTNRYKEYSVLIDPAAFRIKEQSLTLELNKKLLDFIRDKKHHSDDNAKEVNNKEGVK